jgi:hypothetical protein
LKSLLITLQVFWNKHKDILLFIPFLFLFFYFISSGGAAELKGDENRYLMFAKNILNFSYSPKEEVNLWSGPGYPIIVAALLYFGLSLQIIKYINAIFLFSSIFLFYKTLINLVDRKKATIFTIMFGFYVSIYSFSLVPYLLTEPLTIFLISLISFTLIKYFPEKKVPFSIILILSVLLAFLALTKIIFGYVLLFASIISFTIFVFANNNKNKNTLYLFLLALFFCTPYLYYTYTLTGKCFYWGDSGGMSLYWMTTPFPNEHGDWNNFDFIIEGKVQKNLKKNHEEFFNQISKLNSIQKDEAFKKRALSNILKYPEKYFNNWLANIERMLFGYPFSYRSQLTNFKAIPNMFVFVLGVLLLYPTIKLFDQIPVQLKILLLLGFIYLLLSSLLSAYRRQFFIITPIIFIWEIYTLGSLLKIKLIKS